MTWSEPSLAPFLPTPSEVVIAMLQLAGLKEGESLFDLGCGDARVLVIAARDFGANATGVELDEGRAKEAQNRIRELGLDSKVKIIHGDVMSIPVGLADVVTLYLTTSGNERLRPKLERELRPGTRVVSHDFSIPGWEPRCVQNVFDYVEIHPVYLYVR